MTLGYRDRTKTIFQDDVQLQRAFDLPEELFATLQVVILALVWVTHDHYLQETFVENHLVGNRWLKGWAYIFDPSVERQHVWKL